MRPSWVLRLLLAYGLLVGGASLWLWARLSVAVDGAPQAEKIVSFWTGGKRVERRLTAEVPSTCGQGCTVAVDAIVDEAPLLSQHPAVVKFSLVPGRDGLKASIDGKTAYATPDDLVVWGAAAGHSRFGAANIMLGISNIDRAVATLASELGVSADRLVAEGTLRRVVLRRGPGDQRTPYGTPVPIEQITAERVRRGVLGAARHLALHVHPSGDFDYSVDLVTGNPIQGRSWPRQAIAAWFLADVGAYSNDPLIKDAALRAGRFLAARATHDCGAHRCVGHGGRVSLGSTATTILVYVSILQAGWDARFRAPMDALLAFLLSQQRADGELMHVFDRTAGRPIDEQTQYVNGQAALAFIKAYEITQDPKHLEAGHAAIRYATRVGWDFFGSRYFFGNEHWTCQAVKELLVHRDDPVALDFCLRFNAFSRQIQTPEGGYNLNPIHVPRVTETGSRTEAAAATLAAATRAGIDPAELAILEEQVKRCVGYLLGYQFDPGPVHLMAKPHLIEGGMPGSKVDLQSRIDFAQHAGAGMLRYLKFLERRAR